MSAKGSFETGRGSKLPSRLEYVAFYPDRPGRPGSGVATARAMAALSAALRGEDNRMHAFEAGLGAMRGGATVIAEGPLPEPIIMVRNFNLPDGGPIQVPIGSVVAAPGGALRLTHRGGQVLSTWALA